MYLALYWNPGKIAVVEKFLWKISHIVNNAYMAANGEPAIIQLGNLTLIFASPCGGGSISAR